jgi:hypothetical protein
MRADTSAGPPLSQAVVSYPPEASTSAVQDVDLVRAPGATPSRTSLNRSAFVPMSISDGERCIEIFGAWRNWSARRCRREQSEMVAIGMSGKVLLSEERPSGIGGVRSSTRSAVRSVRPVRHHP